MKDKIMLMKTKRVTIITLLVGVLLSMFVLYTPKPVSSNNKEAFSAVRAAEHIEAISRKPHSYYDRDEHKEVREYIVNTLGEYVGDENVSTITYSLDEIKNTINEDLPYELHNVLGVIPGKNKEGILLMAHYDSRGHVGRGGEQGRSYGAMDDGYGVSTMLEIAYLLKEQKYENSIYFLFTDAEEVGLYGAKMASSNKEFLSNIKFLINLESRGRYGPAYMFETSKNNEKVMELYSKAKLPVTYSMATAVYSVMPNYTDFTPFIDKGVTGINFATLAGLDNYHTPLDRYENINLSSIQHMGVQVEPIVREFLSDAKYVTNDYFNSNSDNVFFTLFAGILISYNQLIAIILSLVLVVLFVLVLVLEIKNKTINKEIVTKTLPKGFLLTFGFIALGYIFSNVIAFLGKSNFSLTYTRVSGADLPALIFILAIVFVLFKKIKDNSKNVLIVGLGVNVILTLLTTFVLPGASFLFSVTALFGFIGYFINKSNNKIFKHIGISISYILILLIIIPIIYSFYMALTVGGIAILLLLIIINASVLIPLINKQLAI